MSPHVARKDGENTSHRSWDRPALTSRTLRITGLTLDGGPIRQGGEICSLYTGSCAGMT